MQDFTYKKVLKPREYIPLELLITHGSHWEAEKHTLIAMIKWLLKEEITGKKRNKTLFGIRVEENSP